jgi:RNA polymerase sigma-70 factor (ECF subfamily)
MTATVAGLRIAFAGGGESGLSVMAAEDRFAFRSSTGARREEGEPAERELIRSAQHGSEEALERLFRMHWPKAWRAAYLVVHDSAAAEDIAQEAFLAAIRALDRFDRRRPFGPWLHRIVVNRSIDWTRARTLRRETGGELPGDAVAPVDDALTSPLGDDVVAALQELPPEQRAMVVMRHLLEFTPGEIAKTLGLPRGTVNSRLRRALDKLADELEDGR